MNNLLEMVEGILDGYKAMDVRRKRILVVIVLLAVLVAYIGNVAIKNFNYTILNENLTPTESAEISKALNANGTEHQVVNAGTTVLVKKGEKDSITTDLAMAGIVSNGGFTIDEYAEKNGLGTTKEDKRIYTQALYQSELARQIETMTGISKAEVNINLGSGSKFLGGTVESSASVIINSLGNGSVGSQQVQGIQALVAGKMGNITPADVSVIDQTGALLSGYKTISNDAGIMDSEYQIAFKESFENNFYITLQQQLQRVYGLGKVSVSVDVEIDFSHSTITSVTYDQDGVVINEQLTQDYDADDNGNLVDPNTEPDEIVLPDNPIALLNLVRNWEYGRTETNKVLLPGSLKRMSISVVHDGELTTEEKEAMERIIQAAIGFDFERGDILNVEGIKFAVGEEPVDKPTFETPTYYYFEWLTNDVLMGAAGMGGLLLLFLVLFMRKGKKKRKQETIDEMISDVATATNTVEVPDSLANLSTDAEFGVGVSFVNEVTPDPISEFELTHEQRELFPGLLDRDIISNLSGAGEAKEIIKQFVNATKKLFDDDIDNAIELIRIMMSPEDENPKRALEVTSELLIILGQDYSAMIMKRLSEEEMLRLVQEISRIKSISSSEMVQALSEFANIYDANKYIRKGGIGYAKKLLISTMGEEYASKLTDKIKRAQNGTIRKPFNSISDVDSNKILNILAGEHPQTISLVLAYLNPMTAAKVMSSLPKDLQIDVTLRLATMNTASAEVITAIEGMVEDKVANMTQSAYTDVGGIQAIADIINNVERTTQRNILENLAETHPKISARIRESLFVFEDILTLADADVQIIMRDIEHKVVAMSFKGVSEDLQTKIIGNVSKRNREIIESEAELLGPVSVREIEEAQAKILFRIQELDDTGEIKIEKSKEDISDYVF